MNHMNTFIDSDLCEALRRIYANTPPPPAGFKERILKSVLKV